MSEATSAGASVSAASPWSKRFLRPCFVAGWRTWSTSSPGPGRWLRVRALDRPSKRGISSVTQIASSSQVRGMPPPGGARKWTRYEASSVDSTFTIEVGKSVPAGPIVYLANHRRSWCVLGRSQPAIQNGRKMGQSTTVCANSRSAVSSSASPMLSIMRS